MGRAETCSNLITRAKERADMENDNFISSAEWYRMLNTWTAKLWNHLVKIDPERYQREQTINPVASTSDYEVPADYYGTLGIDWISDNSQEVYVEIKRLFGSEINRYAYTTDTISRGYTYVYNNADPTTPLIRLIPTPGTSWNYRHRYIVAPPKFAVDGTDSGELVPGIAGFEEYVVIGMAIDARIKEESSVVQLRQSLAEMQMHLEEMAENRAAHDAGHVVDVHRHGEWVDPAGIRWIVGE